MKTVDLGRTYLMRCAQEHVTFRVPEIESLAKMFAIKLKWREKPDVDPLLLVDFNMQSDAKKIMNRTVLVRSLYELWGHASTHEELHSQLKTLPKEFTSPYCKPDDSFRIQVESIGKKLRSDTKIQLIEALDFLPLQGYVQLNEPDHSFHLIEYYGTNPNLVPEKPYRVFFGRWITDGQRHITRKLNLKDRKFIGNTSMDPTFSLIMTNMAGVKDGDLVLDPFVGSGSLLVAAAHAGGYVLGTDLDFLMLHGKTKPSRHSQKHREPDESIYANLKQYGLGSQYVDVVVADASLPLWREKPIFNAIIADPPYGIREATERIGTTKSYKIPDHLVEGHIPSKVNYNLQEMLVDLLNFSAVYLSFGGRLVYWMPVFKEDFQENNIPIHPCLKLISYSEQELTWHSSRYLVTMEKIQEPEDSENVTGALVSESTRNFRKKYFQVQKKYSDSASNDR